jgi:aspartyl-tRNA(Asn)/glutamyl-tRNA(Gln) amidotransferase subunit C
MTHITREEVERVVALARLSLSEGELDAMAQELEAILSYVETLGRLDTQGVPPTAHVLPLATPLREDRPAAPLDPELVMANAPEHTGSAFIVPVVIEGEEGS